MYTGVDVIIPTYKPGESLLDILEKLRKQTVEINRIIIINTEKDYFDEKIYVTAPNVEVHHITRAEFDHAATRDYAIKMSQAEYVLLMTMDAVPCDEHLVEKLLSSFENNNVAVAYARQLPKKDCRMQEKYTRLYNYPEKSIVKTKKDIDTLGIKAFFCSDVCAMYKRSIYDKLGGFVEKAIFNEDTFYAAKALENGYAVMYQAEAMVYHSHNYSCMEQLKRNFDLGVSQAEHPEIFENIRSEKEGISLVKNTAAYLARNGKWYEIPYLIVSSAYKYAGYRLGKKYKKLSHKRIMKLTLNKYYWNNETKN